MQVPHLLSHYGGFHHVPQPSNNPEDAGDSSRPPTQHQIKAPARICPVPLSWNNSNQLIESVSTQATLCLSEASQAHKALCSVHVTLKLSDRRRRGLGGWGLGKPGLPLHQSSRKGVLKEREVAASRQGGVAGSRTAPRTSISISPSRHSHQGP